MSELTDVEALIIVIALVIFALIYGIIEIKGADQIIKRAERIQKEIENEVCTR